MVKVTWLGSGTAPRGIHLFCINRSSRKEKKKGLWEKGRFFPFGSGHFSLFSFLNPFLSSFCDCGQGVFMESVVSSRPWTGHPMMEKAVPCNLKEATK